MKTDSDTPYTDAEEERQRDSYERWRKTEWPAFAVDFDFARRMERALRAIENHHGENEGWRDVARDALA